MSRFTENILIRRAEDTKPAFAFEGGDGKAVVDLDRYLIAPKELFTDEEIGSLCRRAAEARQMSNVRIGNSKFVPAA